MEQQQISVSFPLGTKLLISVVTLLLIVIAFLDISTILILKEDKLAYTYQTQSTEALLGATEFTNLVRRNLDLLRLSLANINPTQGVTPQQISYIQNVLNNQTDAIGASLLFVNVDTGDPQIITEFFKQDKLKELQISSQSLEVSTQWLKPGLPDLIKNAFTFFNLSKSGQPMLGVGFADLSAKSGHQLPIGIAYVPLNHFGKEIRESHLSITNHLGTVLFDSDPAIQFSSKPLLSDPLFQQGIQSKISSGAKEYGEGDNRILGSFVKPGLNLVVLTKTKYRKAMSATYTMTEKFVLLGCMAIGAAVIFAILFARTLTAPLNKLYEATKEVAAGNFSLNLKAKSHDEIGALSDSFNVMSKKIRELIDESMAKVRLEGELAIASTVQQTLFPPSEYKDKLYQIHSYYQSATECGGDWWGFFTVQNKLALFIADATGHGLPSALITAAARSCFSVMHKLAQEDPDFTYSPGSMLAYANRVVYDAALGKIMMTFFAGVIDFSQMTVTYANAAHNPPWLLQSQEKKPKLISLTSKGQRLGEVQDIAPFEEKTLPISPGDILFLYTDGLLEGKNQSDQMYGKKRMRQVLERNFNQGPKPMLDALVKDFLRHNGKKPLYDDVTLAATLIGPGQA